MKITEAMRFLDNHPAVSTGENNPTSDTFCWVYESCKNNVLKDDYEKAEKMMKSIYKSDEPELFKKFEDKYYDKDDEDDWMSEDEIETFKKLEVPYKEVYGYDWKFEKYTYMGELCFFKFDKAALIKNICIKDGYRFGKGLDPVKAGYVTYGKRDLPEEYFITIEKEFNYDNTSFTERYIGWNAYQGVDTRADSWEELIIKTAEKVKKNFGDFCQDDFYTKEEKSINASIDEPFRFERIETPESKTQSYSSFIKDDKYISLSSAQLNLRWWEDFRKTEYYKKNWDGE